MTNHHYTIQARDGQTLHLTPGEPIQDVCAGDEVELLLQVAPSESDLGFTHLYSSGVVLDIKEIRHFPDDDSPAPPNTPLSDTRKVTDSAD